MSNVAYLSRPVLVLFAALGLAACSPSQEESHDAGGDRPASSSAGLPAGRVAQGQQRAQVKGQASGQSCVDCHGADGNKPLDPTYPKIGGQYGDYLAHALQAYRSGDRQHPLMTPQAAALSDQDIADLAAYFASQSSQLRDLQGVK
ncbi:cytochrome c [Stenotrophomonas sp. MMGLT7]|uniref:c-type cytochrome n=1 Tax=Stenotrophomonas sp. MMGLT7 TaxID=2901227 RepID=UPI001E3A72A3|nr:cytochrome c [Stenotrophomonas sp. MMGLT7]MCD7097229.1 cytochrome c [Stenotrophomonas sp. MMGLT7]